MGRVFRKLTAQGNDYIYIDLRQQESAGVDWTALARQLSDRNFGIGSDGLVLLQAAEKADVRMEMYNADGSLGKMCGNALRSIIYILSEEEEKAEYLVETESGIRRGWLVEIEGEKLVAASIGKPELLSWQTEKDGILCVVNTGNKHQVRYLNDIDDFNLGERMAELKSEEGEEAWNYEFIEIDKPDLIRMQVWEAGSGATLACGTGAAASVFAGWETGRLQRQRIKVIMPGGSVFVEEQKKEVILTGSVLEVFRGELPPFEGGTR